MRHPPFVLFLLLAVTAGGCSTVYYALIAQLGWAKHDLLAYRIQLTRDRQDQARLQFAEALPRFAALPGAGADAAQVAALRARYHDCANSAALVGMRIPPVEQAADAFFGEWRAEIDAAAEANRARAQEQYEVYRLHYDRLLAAIREAQAAMPPVLDTMEAQLTALEGGAAAAAVPALASDGDRLLRTLQLAIALGDLFIAELESLD